jgi:2-polyprenyl-3-methyl-5-hydroxy-6-metoxy-1,4-benzoquinol methylase
LIFGKCQHIIGIDYSEEAISEAKKLYPQIECLHMCSTNLHFEKESVDKVICFEILEHLTVLQARRTIHEMYKVLKCGGTIIGSTPLRTTDNSKPSTYAHIYEYSEQELRKLLDCFQDVEIFDNNFFKGRKV